MHFLDKGASCLLQSEIRLPRIHRIAVMIDDLKNTNLVQRGCSANHTGTDRKSALGLALTHLRRLGFLDLLHPISSSSFVGRVVHPERTVRKILDKAS